MWRPYREFHPCIHRWLEKNGSEIPPKFKQFVTKPVTRRNEILALPQLRRLLNLWLKHSEILPQEKKEKLLETLLTNGFTIEQLDKMIMEERRRQEILRIKANAGPFDVFDDDGNLLNENAKKAKGKKIIKKKNKKQTKAKDSKVSKKGKIASKKGKIASKKGSKGKNEKKAQHSKKKGKGAKKKTAGHEECEKEDYEEFKAGAGGQLGTGWPHYVGLKILNILWTLEETPPDERFISRAPEYFDIQAQVLHKIISGGREAQLSEVNRCLNLAVWIAQNIIASAQAITDEDVPKLLALKGGELVAKKSKNKKAKATEEKISVREMHQRRWTEQSFPTINPEKKKSNRTIAPRTSTSTIFSTNSGNSEELRKVSFPSQVDGESSFLNSAKWYNPHDPEFLYDGPHIEPENVKFIDEAGNLKWALADVQMIPQPIQPNPVPMFGTQLRPIVHSGEAGPMSSQHGRWYIMSVLRFYSKETPNQLFTFAIKEQLDLICGLVQTMVKVPSLNVNRLLELVSELCESIELSTIDENITQNEKLIDEKRTIVLEKLYVKFFGSKFRDFNANTSHYMRTICQRCSGLIRQLYEYTAIELWNRQQHKNPEIIEEKCEVEEVVEEDIDFGEWEEWLKYLTKSSNEAMMWQKWLQNAIEKNELPEDRTRLIEEAKNWLSTGKQIQEEGEQFREKALVLKHEMHDPSVVHFDIETYEECEEGWLSEESLE